MLSTVRIKQRKKSIDGLQLLLTVNDSNFLQEIPPSLLPSPTNFQFIFLPDFYNDDNGDDYDDIYNDRYKGSLKKRIKCYEWVSIEINLFVLRFLYARLLHTVLSSLLLILW